MTLATVGRGIRSHQVGKLRKFYETYREAGGNVIDTAAEFLHQTARCERFVGRVHFSVIASRKSLVLATKYSNAAPAGDPNAAGNPAEHDAGSGGSQSERLQTTISTCQWVQIWTGSHLLEEVMRGLDDLVSRGKVLYVGISDAPAGGSPRQILWRSFEGLDTVYRIARSSTTSRSARSRANGFLWRKIDIGSYGLVSLARGDSNRGNITAKASRRRGG